MNKIAHKPILVTGSQRSGSTWVGEMINYSHKVNLFTEPFNPLNSWYGLSDFVNDWFHYITEEEGNKYRKELLHAMGLSYDFSDLIKNLGNNASLRGKMGAVKRYLSFSAEQSMGYRPLIKDPLAFFSAEWIYHNLNADVIVLIRHPAEFVSSIKRMNFNKPGWGLDFFPDLLNQKELVEKYLKPYYPELNKMAAGKVEVIEGSILLWNIFHDVIKTYQDKYEGKWMFYRHKDLSLDPTIKFKEVFERLGLEYTDSIKEKIEASTSDKNPTEAVNNELHTLQRNSKANLTNWKHRLTEEEATRVYEGTKKIASLYFSEEEWK